MKHTPPPKKAHRLSPRRRGMNKYKVDIEEIKKYRLIIEAESRLEAHGILKGMIDADQLTHRHPLVVETWDKHDWFVSVYRDDEGATK